MPKMVFCNILKFEITLTRCKPVRGLKQCESCEGYVLKPTKGMLRKLEKKARGHKKKSNSFLKADLAKTRV